VAGWEGSDHMSLQRGSLGPNACPQERQRSPYGGTDLPVIRLHRLLEGPAPVS